MSNRWCFKLLQTDDSRVCRRATKDGTRVHVHVGRSVFFARHDVGAAVSKVVEELRWDRRGLRRPTRQPHRAAAGLARRVRSTRGGGLWEPRLPPSSHTTPHPRHNVSMRGNLCSRTQHQGATTQRASEREPRVSARPPGRLVCARAIHSASESTSIVQCTSNKRRVFANHCPCLPRRIRASSIAGASARR
jgi:hypothetical protein